jgi:hypothetical protein
MNEIYTKCDAMMSDKSMARSPKVSPDACVLTLRMKICVELGDRVVS